MNTTHTARPSRLPMIVLLVGAVASVYPFLALAPYAFPSADDYCLAVEARKGFWDMQAYFYLHWTGRYTAIFLQAILSEWDLARIYPWFCMTTLLATWLAFRLPVAAFWRNASSLQRSVVASVAMALFVGRLPSSTEAFFWLTSAVTYQWGLIAYLAWLSLLVRRASRPLATAPWRVGALAGLTLLLPGFNEITSIIMLVTLVVVVAHTWQKRGRPDGFVVALVLVAAAATAVSLLAPGNVVRSATYPDNPTRHNLAFAAVETLRQFTRFVGHFGSYAALWIAAGTAWWWSRESTREAGRSGAMGAGALTLVAATTVYLTLFPLYWEYGDNNFTGEGRTYNVTYVLFCACVFFAVVALLRHVPGPAIGAGGRLRAWKGPADLVLATALALFLVGSDGTLRTVRALKEAPEYLFAQQMREVILRQPEHRGETVVVNKVPIRPAGLYWGDIQPSESDWINSCVASYYGVGAVRTPASFPTP